MPGTGARQGAVPCCLRTHTEIDDEDFRLRRHRSRPPARAVHARTSRARPHDVAIDILYCGVCHSDIVQARNELGHSRYPMVPGHEIIGRVARVGAEVTRVKAGDVVGVDCLVDSCRVCRHCREGHEPFCRGARP